LTARGFASAVASRHAAAAPSRRNTIAFTRPLPILTYSNPAGTEFPPVV
jgi:hypothetical protein